MIDTYGRYREATPHQPGEHHFITVYLVPRLSHLAFLPAIPTWISPDGSKKQWGDVVYAWPGANDPPRLAIEVKIAYSRRSISFTGGQYNLQISDARQKHPKYRGEPDLLIAALPQGIAVVPWEDFRRRYISRVFVQAKETPLDALPERKGQNAPSFRHDDFNWSFGSFVPLPTDSARWPEADKEFVRVMEAACRKVWGSRSGDEGSHPDVSKPGEDR